MWRTWCFFLVENSNISAPFLQSKRKSRKGKPLDAPARKPFVNVCNILLCMYDHNRCTLNWENCLHTDWAMCACLSTCFLRTHNSWEVVMALVTLELCFHLEKRQQPSLVSAWRVQTHITSVPYLHISSVLRPVFWQNHLSVFVSIDSECMGFLIARALLSLLQSAGHRVGMVHSVMAVNN